MSEPGPGLDRRGLNALYRGNPFCVLNSAGWEALPASPASPLHQNSGGREDGETRLNKAEVPPARGNGKEIPGAPPSCAASVREAGEGMSGCTPPPLYGAGIGPSIALRVVPRHVATLPC